MARQNGIKIISNNRRAFHDYEILERLEAGVVLTGTEVKSLRQGKTNLSDSYATIMNQEAFIIGWHISPYEQGNRYNPDPDRSRKLLLHRREIDRLDGQTRSGGLTLVPLKLYFKDSKVKVELGLARGKKMYDKREAAAERSAEKAIRKVLREGRRG